MKGYTAKVGLRKSRLHFDAIRMRQVVRQVDDAEIARMWTPEKLEREAGA